MQRHSIRMCRKHIVCRWIRHHVPMAPITAQHRHERGYFNNSQDWIIGVLPLVAFLNLVWEESIPAIDEISIGDTELSEFVEIDQWAAIHRFTFLVDFIQKRDPLHESQAYKALAECDPGFRKLEMVSHVFKDMDGIKALSEWNDLDYLYSWIQANVVPRLSLVPTVIAEEAADVFLNTNYLDCWQSLVTEHESLSLICAIRRR
ncbi:hypothetical protein FPOAC2_09958 [Fusarium poae]|uniref:Uncharacterized protein n=1 Tax=Fusarium poae TaxID=36050 RepID=A0A1B8AQD9_FUSPO|nr:hypothetical protein FPOA_09116 [Fusarium poae]